MAFFRRFDIQKAITPIFVNSDFIENNKHRIIKDDESRNNLIHLPCEFQPEVSRDTDGLITRVQESLNLTEQNGDVQNTH